jgi:phytoene desaturase
MSESDPIVVIGAGIGGLSAAIHLAASGQKVIVLEANPEVGGKMSQLRRDGFRWDTGPSIITMRHVFEELFRTANRSMDDYIQLDPLSPLTRYFYPDGVTLDAVLDPAEMAENVRCIAPGDVDGYLRFLDYASRLYDLVGPLFIYDRPPRLASLRRVSPWKAFQFDGLRSMHRAQRSFVRSSYMLQLLGRFATYVGGSPYQAPATLNVIAHVELSQGVWYPRGGVYSLAGAYLRLANELGVEVITGCRVQAVDINAGKVRAVRLQDGVDLPVRAVVANLDVANVYRDLLPAAPALTRRKRRLVNLEPSGSGFIMLLGVSGLHPELAHHNIFFSSDYRLEFERIFKRGRPPDEPTIYVSISSKSTSGDAPPGCENWFVLVNTPALNGVWDWSTQSMPYAQKILSILAQRGYDVRDRLETMLVFTPVDLERMTGAPLGALYGASPNSRLAAFRRPHNRDPLVRSLYYTGGSVHPGGGVPMVTLSGKVAAELLLEDLNRS